MNTKKPNLIYILADDMGYGDVSYLNENSRIKTTHLDRMGEEGIVFSDAHSTSAVCTPSRYSILTGRYNWRSSLKEGVLQGYDDPLIEPNRMTVGSMLKQEGYRTACIGKWHLGLEWTRNSPEKSDVDFNKPIKVGPNQYGFDYFYGISASLDMPPYVYIENDRATAIPDRVTKNDEHYKFWREGPTAPDFKHEEVLPELTSKVLDKIEEYADDPFFIYFPMPAPHRPLLPSAEFIGKSGTNLYGDFVLMCDDVVGKIMKKLDDLGISDQTILVFTSDNGCSPRVGVEQLNALGHYPSYRYRGYKADIYEGGHRIPLLIRWPEMIKPGLVSSEPVCLIDLMRTMADILDLSLPDDAAEDSVSNLSVWLSETLTSPLREAIVHHSVDGSFSIRKDQWKLVLCPGSGGWSDPIPGEEPEGSPEIQLYDLSVDIAETNNVWDEYPEVVSSLKALLTKYKQEGRSTPGLPQASIE